MTSKRQSVMADIVKYSKNVNKRAELEDAKRRARALGIPEGEIAFTIFFSTIPEDDTLLNKPDNFYSRKKYGK